MGASTSRGRDNESLIDQLIERGLSLPAEVERAMRLVDRGEYFSEKSPRAYMDLAWVSGSLHLSAPNIYVVALKNLDIAPGQSFLNVGSGSGYLSTIIGLLLGYNGINHGIELCASNVEFARRQLRTFLTHSDAPLERDFCVPHFVHGNIFDLVAPLIRANRYFNVSYREENDNGSSEDDESNACREEQMNNNTDESFVNPISVSVGSHFGNVVYSGNHPVDTSRDESAEAFSDALSTWPLYDRIYVGAAIRNRAHLHCILRLLNIGGVLIAPVLDEFVKITRTSEDRITRVDLLSVSFAPLVVPPAGSSAFIRPPLRELPTLRKLCGRVLRSVIRSRIKRRHNGLPTLGRLTEVETDVQTKRRRDKVTTSESTKASPITVDARESNSDEHDHSSSTSPENNDVCSDNTAEEQQIVNGFRNESNENSWSGTDQSHTSSSETGPQTVSMARLLHHLLVRSRMTPDESSSLPHGDAATPVAAQDSRQMPDGSNDNSTPESPNQSRILLFDLARDDSSETQTAERYQQLRLRVAERLMEAFRNSGTDSDSHEDLDGTREEEGAETGLSEDYDETEYEGQLSRRQRKQKRRREFRYNPPSYLFRDEMRKIMQEELHLPSRLIEDVFSL